MKLTIFTSTYNRAYIIKNLYRSLQHQSCTDFEWLVVDDGSSDNTKDLFKIWQSETNPFPIRYYYIENGGKCRAINYALDLAEGELFFIMDSDDYLTENAVERIIYWESTINEKSSFCGLMGQRGKSPTETQNRRLSQPFRDGNAFDRYSDYTSDVIDGERADIWYTAVHRKFKYPEFSGEKFMTECVAWNRMAHAGYKIRFFDDIIWIFEYLPDGLTKSGFQLFIDNPRGYVLSQIEKTRFTSASIPAMIKCIYSLYCDLEDNYSTTEIADFMGISKVYLHCVALLHKFVRHTKGYDS